MAPGKGHMTGRSIRIYLGVARKDGTKAWESSLIFLFHLPRDTVHEDYAEGLSANKTIHLGTKWPGVYIQQALVAAWWT